MVVEIAAVVLSWRLEPEYDTILYGVFGLTTVGAGAVIAWRRPENPIGWLFCGFGLLNAIASDLFQGWGLRAAAESWPGGPLAEWIASSSWLVSGYGWALTFALFPTGRLPGPRWRVLPWVGALGLVLGTAGWALSPDRGRDFSSGRNPWAAESLPTGLLLAVGVPLLLGSLMAAVLSLAVRFRRSSGLERQQLKWFVLAASVAGVVLPATFVLWYVTPVAGVGAALVLSALPLAAGAAILRYRLYDIDLFISRTVAYATLTVSLAAAYGVLIVALGILFGRGSGWATAAATVVCAILRLQLSEVEASRARIVAAGHAERRRIERDLHDGAQQRLVSIGLALRHAQHQLGPSPEAVGATLDRAVAEVSMAIGELRELARGLPPTQLDAGLRPAVDDLARRAPLPVSVDVPGERFDPGVEAAAYFLCCEGLTNAVKHANASSVGLTIRCRQQRLLVSVTDDGVGGADAGKGTGLTGLADRIAALGGTFRLDSVPGQGTTLSAELPCGS